MKMETVSRASLCSIAFSGALFTMDFGTRIRSVRRLTYPVSGAAAAAAGIRKSSRRKNVERGERKKCIINQSVIPYRAGSSALIRLPEVRLICQSVGLFRVWSGPWQRALRVRPALNSQIMLRRPSLGAV